MIGIDEAGRGAWAGPLCAAAVLLEKPVAGLKDSKLLSRVQRQKLAEIIYQNGRVGIGWASPEQIDEFGLTVATTLAMKEAILQIHYADETIIVDGNFNYLYELPNAECLIKADSLVAEVSAASIVAKVARDEYMNKLSLEYPDYLFDKHVGYGTKAHLLALSKYGICSVHRRSYKPIQAWL